MIYRKFRGFYQQSIVVLVTMGYLLNTPCTHAAPPINWSPKTVAETVGQSQTKKRIIKFSSTNDIKNIVAWVAPELQPYLTVTPTSFPSVSTGETLTMTLTFSASSTAPLDTYDGTVHLRANESKKTIATPLPVTMTICRCVSAKGLFFNYPSSPEWQLFSRPLEVGGPIALNNFGNAYLNGGVSPLGGAEIDITSIDLPNVPLSNFIDKELVDATVESQTTIIVDGVTATKVVYTDIFSPILVYKNISVYVAHQSLLYKFYLSYHDGDPLEDSFITDFQQVLDSVQFTP